MFQAMFDYDPARCSPNDEPESELLLEAGDYMFVCGDMDEVNDLPEYLSIGEVVNRLCRPYLSVLEVLCWYLLVNVFRSDFTKAMKSMEITSILHII